MSTNIFRTKDARSSRVAELYRLCIGQVQTVVRSRTNSKLPLHTLTTIAMSSSPQGLLVTAGKVHVPFKTELLNALAEPRFSNRPPHLVGILATDKEDARTYAEVITG